MPSRAGYWWGAFLIILGGLIGGILFVVGLRSALGSLPAFSAEFDASPTGTQVAVPAHWALYARANELPPGTCAVTSSSETPSVSPASITMTFDRAGGSWTWVDNIDATQPGTYRVSCPTGHYAVGEQPRVGGFAARVVGGVLGLIMPLFLGICGGAAVIIVTAVRRARGRNAIPG